MGQTLTHGVYLPDEGERNCYSGLAANWNILDGAVGTIAEHTTQIAGKAPLVHTHTKSDITDFPAYGNTAGTICEGNDSRLSDARTPLSHTHTKSDVTDLFNSANTWTALNTYSNGQLALKATSQEIGVIPVSDKVQFISFNDKNSEQIGVVGIWYNSSGSTEMKLSVSDKFKDGVKDPTGTKTSEIVSCGMASNGDKFFAFEGKLRTSLYPFTTNLYNLGSSANQWNNLYANKVNTQSVNGINPGALSLPSGGTTENTDWFNVAGDILPTGGNATNFSWGQNFFTPSKDGWLALTIVRCSAISVWCNTLKYGMNVAAPDASLNRQLVIPVVANMVYEIRITGDSWFSARLIMPKGNV